MQSEVREKIQAAVRAAFSLDTEIELSVPENPEFGDFSTNVAMKLARELKMQPRTVAQIIVDKLNANDIIDSKAVGQFAKSEVAGPGFINITISASDLAKQLDAEMASPGFYHPSNYKDQVVVTEYSDPNPFKVLHIGHLYTSIVGDALSNLVENAGGEVHRVNFGGDVGLHVAKNLWAIRTFLGGDLPEKLAEVVPGAPEARAEFLASRYVEGNRAYEDDVAAHEEIVQINAEVYGFHTANDHKSPLAQIYWTCRDWSYAYFDDFYARIGVKFEKYYPESQTAEIGRETVLRELQNGVYEKSNGAVIFPGEKYGLHTRVFINKQGLPTYEAKDVGLSIKKWEDYHFDKSIIITGNDIIEYMKVVIKSISLFAPRLAERTQHLTHGNVKLAGGIKMSSRLGNFVRAADVLDITEKLQNTQNGGSSPDVVLGAVKYEFLKSTLGPNVIYEPETSVSLTGFSGPYVQYAAVRVNKILAAGQDLEPAEYANTYDFASEKGLLKLLLEYPSVLHEATTELAAHKVARFLFDLAGEINKYYEKTPVLQTDVRSRSARLHLLSQVAKVFAHGLKLLGINVPEKM